MHKISQTIAVFCLISVVLTACPDGQYTNPSILVAGKGDCMRCNAACSACDGATGVCTTYKDNFKGVSGSPLAFTCSGTGSAASVAGAYNKNKDTCDRCVEGCAACYIDYDYCTSCQTGYDWDKSGYKCVRATLGLAAVILALSVLTLIFGVVICLLSCKL